MIVFVSVGISIMYGVSAGEGGLGGLGDGRVGSNRVESCPIIWFAIDVVAAAGSADAV